MLSVIEEKIATVFEETKDRPPVQPLPPSIISLLSLKSHDLNNVKQKDKGAQLGMKVIFKGSNGIRHCYMEVLYSG